MPPRGRPCSPSSRSPRGCSTRAISSPISSSWACCLRYGHERVPPTPTPTPTPATSRTALVAGASGLVGGKLLHLLLEHPAYVRVPVLARRELPLGHKKLEQRVV